MKKYTLLCSLFLLAGCCTQQFPVKTDRMPTIATYEGTTHFILWGLGQSKEINPKDVCGKKEVIGVETHYSFIQGLLTGITYGIYSPRGYSIYCKQD